MKNKQMIFRGASMMILAMLWLLPVSLMAQQQNNETKAERKERQKSEQNQRYLKARQAILDSAFVVRAESLQFRDGVMYLPVQSSINFLKVTGKEAVMQISSDFLRTASPNNLGGITLKGDMVNLKINDNTKKKRLFVTFTLTGAIGTARIAISLNGDDLAVIDVDGMYSGRAFVMRGPVKLPQEVQVYEGAEF
ncbi:MAG: DUF4251 domain-containing protein [Bacteroidales bacterium]|jgi:hypothetical protein|nr:DUF4251 domain-containing protein [Bacteroidales bacterium]NCU34738.1 DUF4251 domain-containing protein [Candidatus Falkowbacteria bacterium]MDD3525902.1 DUF4251 domain-containing protein [Bacteroidales bacterium]MDD4176129.1 DUF4251 domain-containing protein [Bacteroidales bacterium]MDD4740584.1 DUF4251 domain-containing protein [Bacteroidales bacterium]